MRRQFAARLLVQVLGNEVHFSGFILLFGLSHQCVSSQLTQTPGGVSTLDVCICRPPAAIKTIIEFHVNDSCIFNRLKAGIVSIKTKISFSAYSVMKMTFVKIKFINNMDSLFGFNCKTVATSRIFCCLMMFMIFTLFVVGIIALL